MNKKPISLYNERIKRGGSPEVSFTCDELKVLIIALGKFIIAVENEDKKSVLKLVKLHSKLVDWFSIDGFDKALFYHASTGHVPEEHSLANYIHESEDEDEDEDEYENLTHEEIIQKYFEEVLLEKTDWEEE